MTKFMNDILNMDMERTIWKRVEAYEQVRDSETDLNLLKSTDKEPQELLPGSFLKCISAVVHV